MILVQKWPIFQLFFLGKVGQENVFLRYFRTKEGRFWAIKTRSSKSPKIDVFPKGLTFGFRSIMAIFPSFFFRECRPGKCLLGYSRSKKRLSIV